MADINVNRNDRTRHYGNRGAWIFALVLVALLVFVIFSFDRGVEVGVVEVPPAERGGAPSADADSPAGDDVSRTSVNPPPPAVAAFDMFARTPPGRAGAEHEYAATGIERLTAALNAIAADDASGDQEIAGRLATFRDKADQLQANAQSMRHADLVHQVFTSAVALIAVLQERRAPGDETLRATVNTLREQARAVDPAAPLLDQTDQIADFFDTAADAVGALAAER